MARVELISRQEAFTIGDAECSFTLRRPHPDVVQESRRRHTRRPEPGTPGEPREQVDENEVNADILDYVIQDWRGVFTPDGQEAPCTRENKRALPQAIMAKILKAVDVINCQGDRGTELKPLS